MTLKDWASAIWLHTTDLPGMVEALPVIELQLREACAEEREECEQDVQAEAMDCGCSERIVARFRARAAAIREGKP